LHLPYHTIEKKVCQAAKAPKDSGHTKLAEVIFMKQERGEAFNRLPKLLQVSMIHSGALPKNDSEIKNLADKLEER